MNVEGDLHEDGVTPEESPELFFEVLGQKEAAARQEEETAERECSPGWEVEEAEERRRQIRSLAALKRDYTLFRRAGAMISQAAAARILDVHPSRIGELIGQGDLIQLRFPTLGFVGVTLASLELCRARRKGKGLTDAFTELQRLREEENESNETLTETDEHDCTGGER